MATNTMPAWAQRRPRTPREGWDLPAFTERFRKTLRSPETARKYVGRPDGGSRGYLGYFTDWMALYRDKDGITAITQADLDDLEHYFEYLQSEHWENHPGPHTEECEGLPNKEAALNAKRAAISSAFAYAILHTLRTDNPAKAIKLDAPNRKERNILFPHEIYDLVQCARKKSPRAGLVTGMLFGPGLRCEELENVNVENITRGPRGLRLYFKRKGPNIWQTIDLGQGLDPLLDAYLRGRTHGPLIMSEKRRTRNPITGELEHTRLDASGLFRMVQDAGRASGICEQLGPHDGRATTITLSLTDPDTSLHRVMAYYHHTNSRTTMGYNQPGRLTPGPHRNPYGIDWKTQGV